MPERKRLIQAGLAAALALALILGGWWAFSWRWIEGTDDAYVEGEVTALAPRIAGLVIEMAVTDNQLVEAGQVLLRIDDRDYQAKVTEARALVAAREASFAQIDDKVAVQEAQIVQAGASIAAARADLTRVRLDLERTQRLLKEEFASRQLFDTRTAEAAKAEAGVRGSGALLNAARIQIAVLDTERSIAAAQLEQAKAQLAQAEIDLDSTLIRAPLAGIIGNRWAREGQYVRPGQHLLAVVPLDRVWIDANFKETQIGRMKPGDPAEITIDAFPGQTITGRIDSIAPAAGAKFSLLPPENATGNFTKVVQRVPVRIALDPGNPLAGRLRPGLSAVVRVDTKP